MRQRLWSMSIVRVGGMHAWPCVQSGGPRDAASERSNPQQKMVLLSCERPLHVGASLCTTTALIYSVDYIPGKGFFFLQVAGIHTCLWPRPLTLS